MQRKAKKENKNGSFQGFKIEGISKTDIFRKVGTRVLLATRKIARFPATDADEGLRADETIAAGRAPSVVNDQLG